MTPADGTAIAEAIESWLDTRPAHCTTCRRPTPHPPGHWHPHRCGCHTCTVWAKWVDLHRDERGEL